jgi:hypothetical protein
MATGVYVRFIEITNVGVIRADDGTFYVVADINDGAGSLTREMSSGPFETEKQADGILNHAIAAFFDIAE